MAETGSKRGPSRRLTADRVVEVLENRDPDEHPVMSAAQIREVGGLESSKRTVLNRLEELEENGEVESKEVGTTRVWWLPEERLEKPRDVELLEAVRRLNESVEPDELATAVKEKRERERLDKEPSEHYREKFEDSITNYRIVLIAGGFLVGGFGMFVSGAMIFDPMNVPQYWNVSAAGAFVLGLVIFLAHTVSAAIDALKSAFQELVRGEIQEWERTQVEETDQEG